MVPRAAFNMAAEKIAVQDTTPSPVSDFNISPAGQKYLSSAGISQLMPIQAHTFNLLMDKKDVVGRARTGTGKTIAFSLPIAEMLRARGSVRGWAPPAAIIMAPTRELVKQTANELARIAPDADTVEVYGGVPISGQISRLNRGTDIVVGTPGRVRDLVERGVLDLTETKYVVYDEADEMLKMGFQDDMDFVISHTPPPGQRQTCLFSATLPRWVEHTARDLMHEATVVDLVGDDEMKTSTTCSHFAVGAPMNRIPKVIDSLVKKYSPTRCLVFCNTKMECNELAGQITGAAAAINGDLSQSHRERVIKDFRSGKVTVLLATDVAARGLDIPEIDLVLNIGIPTSEETYVHRSGRTARIGRKGTSIIIHKPSDLGDVLGLEQDIGVTFKHIRPQTQMLSSPEDVSAMVGYVNEEMSARFKTVASEIIDKYGAEEGMAKALTLIAGYDPKAVTTGFVAHIPGQRTVKINGSHLNTSKVRRIVDDIVPGAAGAMQFVEIHDDFALTDLPAHIAKKIHAQGERDTTENGDPSAELCYEAPDAVGKLFELRRNTRGAARGNNGRGSGGGGGYGRRSSFGGQGGRGGGFRGGRQGSSSRFDGGWDRPSGGRGSRGGGGRGGGGRGRDGGRSSGGRRSRADLWR
eukprot:TRINITY_DN480_c0_g1_i2.p1 TRINITY_DN480_c0_g1~~TRINITY_DN480_c0_g1_i2.p1  ORF type:complete len:638 (-),score=122.27 TRINITY_DN480_c0_g1_i2:69-1982(-)